MRCDYIRATFRQDTLFHDGRIYQGADVADLRCVQIAGRLGCTVDLAKSSRSGYRTRYQMLRDGEVVAEFLTDGTGDAEGSHMVEASGHVSPEVREALDAVLGDEYSTARRDTCLDFIDEPGFPRFHQAAEIGRTMAREGRMSFDQVGQGWLVEGQTMTFYLGSRNSPVYVRCYTRGLKTILEGGQDDPLRVRIEVEVKPGKAKAKRELTRLEDAQLFGCARWSIDFMNALDVQGIQRHRVGTVWRQSDKERATAHMVKQYGALIEELIERHGPEGFAQLVRQQRQHGDVVRKAREAVAVEAITDAI